MHKIKLLGGDQICTAAAGENRFTESQQNFKYFTRGLTQSEKKNLKWNVAPLIWSGSNFSIFQHFIAPALNLMPCLQAQGTRDCNKDNKF